MFSKEECDFFLEKVSYRSKNGQKEYEFRYPRAVYADGVDEPLCNCSYYDDRFPDVVIYNINGEKVRLDAEIVRGSSFLQKLILSYRNNPAFQNILHDVDTNTNSVKDSSPKDETALLNLIDFTPREVIDLTAMKITIPHSTNVLKTIEQFMKFHLRETLEKHEAERRKKAFFQSSVFPEPKIKESDLDYEEWEEDIFATDSFTFIELYQANSLLGIRDLFYTLEKWFFLNRGRPSLEEEDELLEFRKGKLYNPFLKSSHLKQPKYNSKHNRTVKA